VIVSDGTPTGIGTRQMDKRAAQEYPDVNFVYLNGEDLSTDEMLANLRRLKETSAVIAPAWYADKAGNTFDNKTIYRRISEASPVPQVLISAMVSSEVSRFAIDENLLPPESDIFLSPFLLLSCLSSSCFKCPRSLLSVRPHDPYSSCSMYAVCA
jgi:hypothetical protein